MNFESGGFCTNHTTSEESYELFHFENRQALTKFDALPFFKLSSHLERNQNPRNIINSTSLDSQQAMTNALELMETMQQRRSKFIIYYAHTITLNDCRYIFPSALFIFGIICDWFCIIRFQS